MRGGMRRQQVKVQQTTIQYTHPELLSKTKFAKKTMGELGERVKVGWGASRRQEKHNTKTRREMKRKQQ
jgi:hypothetical protein